MARRTFITLASCALALLAAGAWALAAGGSGPLQVGVAPVAGSRATSFLVSFRAPERTGRSGSSQRHDALTASISTSQRGCVKTLYARAPDSRRGARVRVRLTPRRLAGGWCRGTYRGRIEEIQSAYCPPGSLCPDHVLVRTIGRFKIVVRSASPSPAQPGTDTSPPSFTGLEHAFACTPGPQRPGQTTPYHLSWQAASDDLTPSAQIVYEIYLATAPGGEDFATPTWTTPAGVTSFTTPGLAPHGGYYFVVRARDLAGNSDHNTVEVRGVDPCY